MPQAEEERKSGNKYNKMAYNRRNYLKKVLKVQEIVLREQRKGKTYKEIYYQDVKKQFDISYRTFSNYLGINAKRDLKKLNENR